MPRAKAATPIAPKNPKRVESEAIIRRFLKADQPIYWQREMVVWYRLWKQYPSVAFWMAYELPFGEAGGGKALNMMSWFENPEGQADLARAWLLFHYTPPETTPSSDSQLDSSPQAPYTGGIENPLAPSPPLPPRRPRTIAELLRSASSLPTS